MRVYGSVQICFWERSDTQQLSDQAKLLAIYLLTGPHSNMLGCFRLPDGYITEDLGWNSQTVKKAFSQLSKINFLTRDERMSWMVIHDFLKWNPIQNPRQGIGVEKVFATVPELSVVIKPLAKGLLKYGKYLNKGFTDRLLRMVDGIETLLADCVADKEQNQDQKQNQEQNQDQEQNNIYPLCMLDDDTHGEEAILNADNHLQSLVQPDEVIKSQAIVILDFLNLKAGRVYRPVDANLKFIIARLDSGVSVMDCRQVIAKKTREWKDDPKMSLYLRPETLFNATKFEQYLGELVLPKEVEHVSN